MAIKRTAYMILALAALLFSVSFMGGCNEDYSHFDDENDNNSGNPGSTTYTYTVTMVNLTNNQSMSPIAVVIHNSGYTPWTFGESASDGLEELAEDGEPDAFLDEAEFSGYALATGSGSTTFEPGESQSVSLKVSKTSGIAVSVAAMLGNTNDCFTGIAAYEIGGMKSGDTTTVLIVAYDAGTEANTETAETVPGPAALGEGYNSERDDVDYVSVHRGVVTTFDGLESSVLDESHRFNNPVAKVIITRS